MDELRAVGDPETPWKLTATHLSIYKWAVSRPFVSVAETADVLGMSQAAAQRALDELTVAQLMESQQVSTGGEGAPRQTAWRVLNPQIAASRLAAAESRLRQTVADLDDSRKRLDELFGVYSVLADAGCTQNSVEVFGTLSAVLSLVDEASLACKEEMVTCQPGGGRPPEQLEQALARDLALLGRGVRMRTLYQHSARYHAPTRDYVEKVTAAGAEVRTCPELFGRLIAFDRSAAFIPHHSMPGGAAVVRDASTLAFLCGAFDRAWDLATPFGNRLDTLALGELHQNILRLLGEGARDETIARRLGMSLRTCRKHVAEIFEQLGAKSRFQAGYLTGDRGVLK
ncbi:helix-turn-helix transcriptional regulator [Actinacidiphila sp. DG2A-62]|uniref:helix-turn-helix transcriptional regulator n=1 Tax=Actinacidiphila sp. DG2A-62 TaxID=3108821 RepID=UPI002DBCE6D8|nr:helix-turn-helix transcriptional regulator [Actinacidiphila sp. DG2A-62]MEC3992522.1 helix-turn-helix transcriptional regulator [Actinacidiphila sp. DG2A-62]